MTDELMKGAGDASLEALYRQHIATPAQTKGCVCQNCNKAYETDLLVPDDVWERIKPEGSDVGAGLLCPTCIMDRTGWPVGFVYPDRRGPELVAGKPAQTKADALEVVAWECVDLVMLGQRSVIVDVDHAGMRKRHPAAWTVEPLVRLSEAASRINEALIKGVCFEGVAKRKLDDLTSPERGWEVCGYAIRKGDEYGLVTTGAFVGWFSVTERNDADARCQLQAAQSEIARMREALGETADELEKVGDWINDTLPIPTPSAIPMLGRVRDAAKAIRTALTPQEPK